jgi:hypothetical protein
MATVAAPLSHGVSQRQAAKLLGVTQSTINKDVNENRSKSVRKSITEPDEDDDQIADLGGRCVPQGCLMPPATFPSALSFPSAPAATETNRQEFP